MPPLSAFISKINQISQHRTKAVQQYIIHIKCTECAKELENFYPCHKQKCMNEHYKKIPSVLYHIGQQKTKGNKYHHISHQVFKTVKLIGIINIHTYCFEQCKIGCIKALQNHALLPGACNFP